MKAFVTGATGQVGSALCERLVKEGHAVRAFVRPSSDTAFLESLGGIELVRGNIPDEPAALAEAIGDADTVFHTAALVDDWAERARMVEVNIKGLEKLLEACESKSIRRFVYLSSLVVLGMDSQVDLDETAPFVHTGDNYNYTKILAEEVAQRYAAQGFPLVILRPPYIYGPRDRQFFPRLVGTILEGKFKFIGGGVNPISLVYVGNLVEAMMLAAEKECAVGQTYIITDGQSVTRRQLVESICRQLGVDVPRSNVPVWVARLGIPILEGIYRLFHLKGSPILNRFKFKFMCTPLTFKIDKAMKELGYAPVMGTPEGLSLSIDWYRKHVLGDDQDV